MPNWTKEQLQAISEKGKNILVSAGAGSGKTAVLTERVIRKLQGGCDINRLLILTFTKAAANEMKERIKKALKDFNLTEQLDKIDTSYITTFDAYALAIVKKYHYLLNVSRDVSIADENIINVKRKEILDNIFEEEYKKRNSNFVKLIDDYCCKDDDTIKEDILTINNKLDLIYDKEDYLNTYIDKYYNDKYIDDKIKEYENLLFDKLGNIRTYLNGLEDELDIDSYQKFNDALEELLLSANYDDIKSNIVKLPSLPKNSSDLAKKYKDKLSKELDSIEKMCNYDSTDDIKNSIKKTKDYVEVIIDIIKKLDKKLNEFKYEKDLYEFIDIAKMAIKVVDDVNISSEIKNNLDEIMIDEYQDTNDLQELFISKIANNNVYMVGDIKQSIYSFRNANPNLFKNKYDAYSKFDGGVKIDLNKNFRSRKEIVNSINDIFDSVMDDKFGGASYRSSHRMVYGNIDYQGLENNDYGMDLYNYVYDKDSNYTKEELEAFIIASDIKKKISSKYQVSDKKNMREISYGDIAILIDRKTNFDLYKQVFDYYNIPIAIYDDEVISESMDFRIIKNIISLIINKEVNEDFKYAFISVLRSYLFNISDDKIFSYFANNSFNTSPLMDIINSIDTNNLNCYMLLEIIIDKFHFYERLLTISDIENHILVLENILKLARNMSKMGYTIEDFYNYLNNISDSDMDIKFETMKNPDAVKLMTIHKSKGLEFSVCYYPGLYARFNDADLKDRFCYSNHIGIISPLFDNGIRSTIYKELYKADYKKELISEKIRLFYVALTRAKEKMILLTSLDDEDEVFDMVPMYKRNTYNSFLDIVNSLHMKLNNHIVNIGDITYTPNYKFAKSANYKDKINKVDIKLDVEDINIDYHIVEDKHFSKSTSTLISADTYNNINFGRRIHSVFENIDFNNPDYGSLDEFEKKCVQKFIDTGILEGSINIYKEFEFVYMLDNINYHGIIDLLIEYDNEFKIVDYKLKNITDEAYMKQLNGYKKYIESISNKKVMVYLYSILEGELREL